MFVKRQVQLFNQRIAQYGNKRYVYCWIDFAWSALLFGCSPGDYFIYEFYRKSNYEKNRFITWRRNIWLNKTYNKNDELVKVTDKRISNKLFSSFISREWIDTEHCGFADFLQFVQKHVDIIVKPVALYEGNGIYKYSYRQGDDLKQKFAEIRGKLVEEIIIQHPLMAALNPSSVNTVRVLTFTDRKGIVHIISCVVKTSANQNVVDNEGAGGIYAGIDIDTGMVFTSFVNKKFQSYIEHPFTGMKIIGFKIPNWQIVLKTVKEAALLVPQLRYLGWDIAILENGVELVEVNQYPAHSLAQRADQSGKYEIIKKHMAVQKLDR